MELRDGRGTRQVHRVLILDPAVGSGAFLLEALAWLEERRAALLPLESAAERRRTIVRDCLFGVDVDPMAVRLAELRLWLALVGDAASPDAVCPLPNLDQHLRQGDSLLSPVDLGAARVPEAAVHVRAVAETRVAYFGASGAQKMQLARRIRTHERAIASACAEADLARLTAKLADATGERDLFGARATRGAALARAVQGWRERRRELRLMRDRIAGDDALPFFAYDVHFGEIVAEGGFDVVLGNPPWVRGERLPASVRERLGQRYAAFRASPSRRGFAHLPDLSVAFVERALQLVREEGVVGMVLPAKLLRAGYAGPLRCLLSRRATVLLLEDRSQAAHGFGATVFPMIAVLRRRPPSDDGTARVALHDIAGGTIAGTTRQDALPLDPDAPRAPWLVLPGALAAAFRSALRAGPPLASRFQPRIGVKTGANEIFLRPLARAEELPTACRALAVQGRDIAPFRVVPGAALLAPLDERGRPLPAIPAAVAKFLAPFSRRLAQRADAKGAAPWALFRTELLAAPWLVLWRDIAGTLEAAPLDRSAPGAPIPLNTCYGVAVPDEPTAWWLNAWLNSGPLRAMATVTAERASGGVFRFSAATVGALPLPPRTDAQLLASLEQRGRDIAADLPGATDALDRLVADALGLPAGVAAELARLGAALRRDTGRDR
jgi:hypothetical protein